MHDGVHLRIVFELGHGYMDTRVCIRMCLR
jgi:hypothetical protein